MDKLPNGSVDAIITDLPYPKEYEYLFTAMAQKARRVLRAGGSLVTLCGHYQLARVLPAMAEHLRYRWMIKLDQPGAHARMAMGVVVTWKPMLWFTNGPLRPHRNITDCAVSSKRSKSSGHPWEQDLGYALWGIESVTDKDNLILDPFMGSGTTAIACMLNQRNFIGIEIDQHYYDMAKKRIAYAEWNTQQEKQISLFSDEPQIDNSPKAIQTTLFS
jgi:DNA modification methylase